jgi:hypothetical protein
MQEIILKLLREITMAVITLLAVVIIVLPLISAMIHRIL